MLPTPRPRTPLKIRRQKRHRILRWRRGQRKRRLRHIYAIQPQLSHSGKRSPSPDIGHPTFTMVLQATRHPSQLTPYPTPSFTMQSWTYSPTGKPRPPKKTLHSFCSYPPSTRTAPSQPHQPQPSYNTLYQYRWHLTHSASPLARSPH